MTGVAQTEWDPSGVESARVWPVRVVVGGLAIAAAGAYGATLLATDGEPLLVAPLVGALVGLAVFVRPLVGLYMLFGLAILLEQWEITGLAPLTAQTHFFQNISGFSNVPVRLSACDLLALMTLASWTLRRLVAANEPLRAGPFAWGIAAYGMAFAFGTAIGIARGGSWDEITTLAEARGPLYLCLLYLLTANLIHQRRQAFVLLWAFVLLVAVKSAQAIGNYATMTAGPYRFEAVTSHEDVVFFDIAVALLIVMAALRVRGRLFYALLAVQPLVLTAELLTQRRVAFVALAAVLAVVALMVFLDRPRLTAFVVTLGIFAFAVYAVAFWDRSGPLAEPIRVIREVVDPQSVSDRDRLSNVWREIENVNIAYTMRQLPLTGVGLGQEYLFQQEPPPLTSFVYWRYMAHNAVLWLWLKAGPFGALAFWFLVAQVVMRGLWLYRRLDDSMLRVAASFPVMLMVAQVVFSSVDLGLTYNRTMIVLGVALGLAAPLAAWSALATGTERAKRVPVGGTRFPTSPWGPPAPSGGLPTVNA
jgi:hypothetical protein